MKNVARKSAPENASKNPEASSSSSIGSSSMLSGLSSLYPSSLSIGANFHQRQQRKEGVKEMEVEMEVEMEMNEIDVGPMAIKSKEEISRAKNVQLHMTLLVHTSDCTDKKCASDNCAKMKSLLRHCEQCKMRATGGCSTCKRIWALLQIHARQCRVDQGCPVPRCHDLKLHLLHMKKEKQLEKTNENKLLLKQNPEASSSSSIGATSVPRQRKTGPKSFHQQQQSQSQIPIDAESPLSTPEDYMAKYPIRIDALDSETEDNTTRNEKKDAYPEQQQKEEEEAEEEEEEGKEKVKQAIHSFIASSKDLSKLSMKDVKDYLKEKDLYNKTLKVFIKELTITTIQQSQIAATAKTASSSSSTSSSSTSLSSNSRQEDVETDIVAGPTLSWSQPIDTWQTWHEPDLQYKIRESVFEMLKDWLQTKYAENNYQYSFKELNNNVKLMEDCLYQKAPSLLLYREECSVVARGETELARICKEDRKKNKRKRMNANRSIWEKGNVVQILDDKESTQYRLVGREQSLLDDVEYWKIQRIDNVEIQRRVQETDLVWLEKKLKKKKRKKSTKKN